MIASGSGIGRACAVLLAKEGAAGILVADLAIDAARDVVAECKLVATSVNFHAEAIRVDVTSEDSVQSLMRQTVEVLGRMDYCINCAGVSLHIPAIRSPFLTILNL